LNESDAFGLGRPVAIGIGINTGVACVGDMGSESRFNYSAVGDTVNVSARIESASKEIGFDIVLSATAAARLPEFALLDAGLHALKGKSESQHLFLLAGDESMAAAPGFIALSESHREIIAQIAGGRTDEARNLLFSLSKPASEILSQLGGFYELLARKLNGQPHMQDNEPG